jgi:hypothetical protein
MAEEATSLAKARKNVETARQRVRDADAALDAAQMRYEQALAAAEERKPAPRSGQQEAVDTERTEAI